MHIKLSCCIKLLYQISNRVNLKLSGNKTFYKYFASSTVIWGNQPANNVLLIYLQQWFPTTALRTKIKWILTSCGVLRAPESCLKYFFGNFYLFLLISDFFDEFSSKNTVAKNSVFRLFSCFQIKKN